MTEFEKLGGTYRQAGNYFLPNLEMIIKATYKSAFGGSDTGDI